MGCPCKREPCQLDVKEVTKLANSSRIGLRIGKWHTIIVAVISGFLPVTVAIVIVPTAGQRQHRLRQAAITSPGWTRPNSPSRTQSRRR
ncbi:MAG: hypothetical protein M3Z48_04230 [Lactobacillus sp.]|nr:hypothetical protein [Lactobacillus sp.]